MKQTSLKKLHTKLTELEEQLRILMDSKKELSKKETKLRQDIEKSKKNVAMLKRGGVIVSEHAIMRYLERVMGLDVEQAKKDVLPESTRILVEAMSDGTFPATTHRVVVKDGVVTTILEK